MPTRPDNAIDQTPWDEVPVVHYNLPGCHFCGHHKFDMTRSVDNKDGTHTQKMTCRNCRRRNKIVPELPIFGSGVLPLE